MPVTQSEPKKRVKDFIRNAKMDKDYMFELEGDELEAGRFIHRMRVELSRMRDLVKQRGKVPRHFKMIHIGTEKIQNSKSVMIVLRMTTSTTDVTNEVSEILDDLSVGDTINGQV